MGNPLWLGEESAVAHCQMLVGAHLGEVGGGGDGGVVVEEGCISQQGQSLRDVGGAVVAVGDGAGGLEEGVHRPVDGVGGCLDGGVEGLHLGVQVFPQSDFHDEVLPFLLASLKGGRAVWLPDSFGEETTLHFTQAGFANAEEVARFFSLRV